MAQITEDFVSYGTAITLKEKKFDVPVKNYYSIYTEDTKYNLQKKYGAKKNWNSFDLTISRPPQSLVMKWLREVHHIFIRIIQSHIEYCMCEIYYDKVRYYQFMESFNSYEDACETAIKYCLENLI